METRSNFVLVGSVTLALLVATLLFIVWLSGVSSEERKCYDIYFSQGVGGLNKGSNVSFSGVPVGQITKISLLPKRPEFVWVRIEVDEETPVLQGTTAQVKGVGFTGVSEIQLQGAVKGARPIAQLGPEGCPVIPSSAGGLGALLNSAPELLERIQRLTERLTELLSDKNQNAISDILENIDRTTQVLADRAPELGDAMASAKVALTNAGIAAERVAALADNTNRLVNDEGKPAAQDLRKAIASMQRAADNLDTVITEARPGIQNFSKSTLPEANRLVRDMRELTQSLRGVADRVEQGGIGGTLGPEKLPDYEPRKKK
ncbi:MCE family protein [Sphingomonas sinipercae]|uniref:MCE family protein n=1 Tax=Sphingomonas sinipercae TaxID=2714944 RepID=A0A6G7ZLG3_9SPHN|nr:MlaD family protein [Sphingomonas sinipercae]QIL01759.1 MCE family protein [Sphingomonas sinipercae]